MKLFALRDKDTGAFAVFSTSTTDGEFCVSVEFELSKADEWDSQFWVTSDRATADKVAVTNTEWFNASFNSPVNSNAGNWEVVELGVVG